MSKKAPSKMLTRDEIRAATIGAKKHFRTKIIQFNGVDVEIRQPTLRERRTLQEKCLDDKGNVDLFEFLLWAVIVNTYVPGTKEKVFDDADYEALLSEPIGGFVDRYSDSISDLMNVSGTPEKN